MKWDRKRWGAPGAWAAVVVLLLALGFMVSSPAMF